VKKLFTTSFFKNTKNLFFQKKNNTYKHSFQKELLEAIFMPAKKAKKATKKKK
jgi:hypothetical protein